MTATTTRARSVPEPSRPGPPTPLALAERYDSACSAHAAAAEASRLASSAHEAALAARQSATNRAMAARTAAMHGRDEGEVAAARVAVNEAVAAASRLEVDRRAAAHDAAEALAEKTAAGAALAQALHARGLEFARWGDRLIVDRSEHPDPDSTRYPLAYRTGTTRAVRMIPPSVWAVEVVPLPDVSTL